MILKIETDNKELIKAIKAMAKMANTKVKTLDDTRMTAANKRAWIKAREELERGETITLSEFKEKYGR